jgi:hypothetical protein
VKETDPVAVIQLMIRDPDLRSRAAESIRTASSKTNPLGLKVQQVAWTTWFTNANKLFFVQTLYAALLRHPELEGIEYAMHRFLESVRTQYPDVFQDMDDLLSELKDESPASLLDNFYREQVEEYVAEILAHPEDYR